MIITVINQKGGVGKTTTSVNLSYTLSKNKNTALLDLDPEGGATISFGIKREKREYPLGGKSVNIFNVEVFLAHIGLLKLELNGDIESIVSSLKKLAENFDFLVIDTPPNLGTLAVSAMIAGDKIVTPITPQPLVLEAAKNLDSRLQGLRKPAIAFTNMSKKSVKLELPSVKSIDLSIPQSKLFSEATRLGVPALRYEEFRVKRPKFSQLYEDLAKVVIEG
ncbi:ParA family protein [Sulfolobus acidocaldarius]|uniref:ParA ATPase n=4 Tax=Sulfolobus acidocaldarius TaxID=2285 RepID=Q4JC56_SULAC|nr:ParA family protein [Sulfolobus acidocaldarius]AAY79623.1 parA ATPase [Sulfolobus acidocaldarius DSM 639]AGE70177.1 parA ATPase [Sulfolobus acidocaldarius N8]AGE72452.1 parA ATPase [Sulfolobus acidocaldarius Ron12/I]ALU29413.1 chromosome partitioning protein ParA [Sulfolobus acidocaldarius]ALU32141.1 chromosome partitioning protein ParA [Sulfolobus acidocaldarius]